MAPSATGLSRLTSVPTGSATTSAASLSEAGICPAPSASPVARRSEPELNREEPSESAVEPPASVRRRPRRSPRRRQLVRPAAEAGRAVGEAPGAGRQLPGPVGQAGRAAGQPVRATRARSIAPVSSGVASASCRPPSATPAGALPELLGVLALHARRRAGWPRRAGAGHRPRAGPAAGLLPGGQQLGVAGHAVGDLPAPSASGRSGAAGGRCGARGAQPVGQPVRAGVQLPAPVASRSLPRASRAAPEASRSAPPPSWPAPSASGRARRRARRPRFQLPGAVPELVGTRRPRRRRRRPCRAGASAGRSARRRPAGRSW